MAQIMPVPEEGIGYLLLGGVADLAAKAVEAGYFVSLVCAPERLGFVRADVTKA
jgi:hypothetical protein